MTAFLDIYGPMALALALGVHLFGGFVKGTVGFGLPMIAISGVGSFLPAEVAIASLILPGLVSNVMQSFRNGVRAALATLKSYWRMYTALFLLIGLFAQLVVILPESVLFVLLGGMVTLIGLLQLSNWQPSWPARLTPLVEWGAGVISGIFGGLAGVWGPPILLYLLARGTPKVEIVRAQGICFLIGSVILLLAHTASGVLNPVTVPFSMLCIVPAVLGMALGQVMQDRLPQEAFRRLTLFVLVIAGLNLLRRGLMG